LYLAALFLIWLGFIRFKRLYRLMGYGLVFIGLFNHLVLILTLIPFGLALFLALAPQHQFNRQILYRRSTLAEIIGVVLLIATVLLVGQSGFDARLAATTDPALIDEATLDFQTIAASVLDPSEIQGGFASILHYFDENLILSLAVLTGIGIIVLLSPNPWGPADRAAFMLVVMMALLILEMVLFLDGKWRHGRYYFLVLYPLLLLSASYGLTRLVDFSQAVISRFIPAGKLITSLLLLAFGGWLSFIMLSTSYKEMEETFKTYRYDLGWSYVSQHLKPEDTTISAWPAAAYLYNHHLDYYANQEVPVVMADPTYSYMVDKYAGARFINSIQELNQVFDQPGQTWFVEEDARLFNFFEADFVQQLFHQMTLVKSFDNIHVFVEREGRWPLAETPIMTHSVDLPGQAKFIGYAFQPAKPTRSQPIFLTLFWQPPNSPVFSYKVFVHLRNSQGATVAQADFVPLEGATVDLKGWVRRVGSDEILRTGITLGLPADLPNDSYSLWVGVYEADSLQRLSVANDTSGENAIKLEGSLIELR
jgi:hypothetical protein